MENEPGFREFAGILPFSVNAKDRIHNEMVRMKADMDILLASWNIDDIRGMFGKEKVISLEAKPIVGEDFGDQCRSALQIGGFTYLADACFLSDFTKAEQLRLSKVKLFTRLISRDEFFHRVAKNAQNNTDGKTEGVEANDIAIFDLIGLPADLIGQIMRRSNYKDAQSLASTCRFTNDIYQEQRSQMLLPNIALILEFTSGELKVRWLLDKEDGQDDANPDKVLLANKENAKKKCQLLNNTTLLRIETLDDFTAEDMGSVLNYVGNRTFPKIVVKGAVYSENMKMMVEMFDKEVVEMDVNKLPEEEIPFPDIKTISIRDNLSKVHGRRLFAAKQFLNISCALTDIDTLRKALNEWDCELREIGRWLILKQFTIFQTPFGRRHRPNDANRKGYLAFISEPDSSQLSHGEITEYIFQPTV